MKTKLDEQLIMMLINTSTRNCDNHCLYHDKKSTHKKTRNKTKIKHIIHSYKYFILTIHTKRKIHINFHTSFNIAYNA